jgi:cyclase
MSRTLIVARIRPGAEPEVGRIFATSDATDLPVEIGVQERSLYSLHDIYIHVIDFGSSDEDPLARARALPGFKQISRDLAPYISPYDPSWARPQDAVAQRFYHWRAPA